MNTNIIKLSFSFFLVLLIFVIFGSTIFFKFNIIYDHHVVSLLGPDKYLGFEDFIKYINKIILQIQGFYMRVILTHFWLPFETIIFQDNPSFFYLSRIVIISTFFVTLFFLSSNLIGNYFSLILTTLFISSYSIADISTRILTSEIVSIIALIFLFPTIFKFIRLNNFHNYKINLTKINIFIYFIFFNILILSKESFTPFIIFSFLIVYLYLNRKIENSLFLITNLLIILIFILYCALVFGFINKNLELVSSGSLSGILDFDLKNCIRIIYKFSKYFFVNYAIHILIFFYIFAKYRNTIKLTRFYIISFVSISFIFFQFVIYNGDLPSNIRYDFILDLLFYFNSLFFLHFLKRNNFYFFKSKIVSIFFIFLLSLLISKISILQNTYKNVQEKKNDTIYFNQTIKNIKELSLSSPNLEILVIATNVWDYEPISSIYKFLKYENINNEIFLKLAFNKDNIKNKTELIFYDRLNDVSFQKDHLNAWSENPGIDWGYSNLKKFSDSKKCIEIIIYGPLTQREIKKKIESRCIYSINYFFPSKVNDLL
jgi:hypothetical protein